MTNPIKRRVSAAAIAAACLVGLAACGGGGGGNGGSAQQDEDTLASSWPGMLTFAQRYIGAMTNDTAEPRDISAIKAPADDTDEPATL